MALETSHEAGGHVSRAAAAPGQNAGDCPGVQRWLRRVVAVPCLGRREYFRPRPGRNEAVASAALPSSLDSRVPRRDGTRSCSPGVLTATGLDRPILPSPWRLPWRRELLDSAYAPAIWRSESAGTIRRDAVHRKSLPRQPSRCHSAAHNLAASPPRRPIERQPTGRPQSKRERAPRTRGLTCGTRRKGYSRLSDAGKTFCKENRFSSIGLSGSLPAPRRAKERAR
jgi:hypothetical protein